MNGERDREDDMPRNELTRRTSMSVGAAAFLGGAGPGMAQSLPLGDPKAMARIRAKIMGSTVEEPVHTYMRLHIYGYRHDGNLVPLYTMSNLNIRRWTPQPDGSFKAKVFECGTYTKFDSDEPLDEWENPFTGERIKVWNFLAGPLNISINADGSLGAGAETTVRARPQNFEVIGDTLFMPQASAFSYPNPFQPKDWPKESSGEKTYWDSHYLFQSKLADALNPTVTNAPATVQLQNLVSWGYWIRMGQQPGRSWGRGFGSKLRSLDDMPRAARREMEKKTPKIFETATWTELVNETDEYKKSRKPG
jgi:hypothetical protein